MTILSKITAFLFLILFIFAKQAILSSFERGMDAANVSDFTTALKKWKPLAENGDAMVQLSVRFL